MATADEKLCLQWNDFRENISSAFGDLRQDKEFTDVTLACEDGQQVEAHKVVLVASSPFFMNLLKNICLPMIEKVNNSQKIIKLHSSHVNHRVRVFVSSK